MSSSVGKILGLIPARGGSKDIPGKNIVSLAGQPLISYTIEAALESRVFDRVVVSTDDEQIAEISREWGAEIPYMRPAELAEDNSGALEVIQHMVSALMKHDDWLPEWIVYLQPTSPMRSSTSVQAALGFARKSDCDSLVSVTRVPHQFSMESQLDLVDGYLVPARPDEPSPTRRQDKPVRYARNGPAILVTRYETVMNKNSLYGDTVLPFEMSARESHDIDEPYDLEYVEWLMIRERVVDE